MKKENIVLIGMPGAGKSTIGVVLAKALGWDFIDSDLLIQKKTGKKLPELILELGAEGFLDLEGRINAEIKGVKQIIATGGSVVYNKEAMQALGEKGLILYIDLKYEAVVSRLGNLKNRGVVLKEDQSLHDLYMERIPLYEKYADIDIKIPENSSIRESVERIAEVLEKYGIR